MTALLVVTHVSASHGSRRVLDDVSLKAEPGKVLVVLGPNGAGKSTLLRVMLGLHAAEAGTVQLSGAPLTSRSRREIAQHVSWVPQHFEATAGFTVEQVALMGRTPHLGLLGLPSQQDMEDAKRVLAELGLSELGPRAMKTLSGGEQRLVLLARALLQRPKLLLLDEPTAFLDLKHQVALLEKLRVVAASGVAVVAVLHDVNLAAGYADEVLLLKAGRVLADGRASDVLNVAQLEALYGLPMKRADAEGQSVFAPAATLQRPQAR
ncbi:MAG: ABC transporter ATP-binding protein [Myxococcaceae bacterium]